MRGYVWVEWETGKTKDQLIVPHIFDVQSGAVSRNQAASFGCLQFVLSRQNYNRSKHKGKRTRASARYDWVGREETQPASKPDPAKLGQTTPSRTLGRNLGP